jgi:hypothetical protein
MVLSSKIYLADNDGLDPTELDVFENKDIIKWKNLNSFVARITNNDFAPWLTFPIWELRSALECPIDKRTSVKSCRIWVATEWILRCGDIIYDDMSSQEQLDEDTSVVIAPGFLCECMSPRSIQRWEFWRKRFLDIVSEWDRLELEGVTRDRVSNAAMKMDAVVSGPGVA